MTPVCPACRAPLALDASICPRCGMAVRPTCSDCGEPLQTGVDSCWRCAARVEAAPVLARDAVTTAVLDAPVVVAAPPRVRERRRHPLLFFVVALVVLVCALLAYEVGLPKPKPLDATGVLMHQRGVAGSFNVDVPIRWEFTVDGGTVVFSDPDAPNNTRGLRIVRMKETPSKAKAELRSLDADLVAGYRPVRTVLGLRVDGHPAFRHDFVGTDTVYEQWFVQRTSGTFRLDFFARPDQQEDAHALNERIVRSFREL